MFKKNLIRDLNQKEVSYEFMIERLKELEGKDFSIHIGGDSQIIGDKISFVTCICAHNKYKGADGFYIKEKIPLAEAPSLRAKISREAYNCTEVAFEMQEHLCSDITIHLDIGDNPKKNKTFFLKNELTNMVTGQGFSVKIKPHSWASSGVADWFTKT